MSKLEELIAELCPDGVPYYTLGELGKFYGGLTGKTKDDFTEGNAKFITYRNIYSNPAIKLDVTGTVKIAEGEMQRTLEYGDIIFTGSSETPDECGISSVLTVCTDEKLYLNSFCFLFRFDDISIMLPDFAKHLFRSSNLRYQIGKTASGVTRFNVSKQKMEKVVIPVPPLQVQKKIVHILDNFTELIAELIAELTARKKQYEYYTQQLLTFGEHILTQKLCELITFKNGKGHEKNIVADGKYVVVNSKFIATCGEIRKYSNSQICPLNINDILMVMSDLPNGRALAKCFLVESDDKYTLNQRIGCFHVNDESVIFTKFLFYILNRNEQLLRYDNGVDQTNLRKDDILNISIPVPHIIEQERIVGILELFDSLCKDISTGLPAEIKARQKQYEYYRDKLLTFKELV